MDNRYDVVVVGSGFGGGTVALRLAQAGKSVCVLERGRRWRGQNMPAADGDAPATNFPELGDKHFFWGSELWRPMRQRLGLYDLRQFANLQGIVGAGVGGGSLIWANVVVEAPEEIFGQGWPKGINRQSLDRYYRMANPYLRPTLTPGVPGCPDAAAGRRVKHAEVLKQAAELVGRPWRPVKIAVNFADEFRAAPNGHGRARQLGCNYCGPCPAGCPQMAKNTVDITYLAEAEALGIEVRPLHLVTAIKPLAGGYRVYFKRFELNGCVSAAGFVDGRQVVLSAGTFGTNELLLSAKKRGLMPRLSDALGCRFSINGNVLSGALKPGSPGQTVETNSGPAIASMIDYGTFAVEDIANPTWSNGIVGVSQWRRILGFALALAGHKPTEASLAKQSRDLLMYVGTGCDSACGRLRLNTFGMLSLDWPGGIKNEPVVIALHRAMSELAAVQGRQYVPNVFSTFGRLVTYHPLGGCAMADSAERGVVDSTGRVFGYPGLYVADGSIIPTAIGKNPGYTVAALAERVAERVAEECC